MRRLLRWLYNRLPCEHKWFVKRQGFLQPLALTCIRCGKRTTRSTPQSREPWRDW